MKPVIRTFMTEDWGAGRPVTNSGPPSACQFRRPPINRLDHLQLDCLDIDPPDRLAELYAWRKVAGGAEGALGRPNWGWRRRDDTLQPSGQCHPMRLSL